MTESSKRDRFIETVKENLDKVNEEIDRLDQKNSVSYFKSHFK